jgi:hypothetical protein
MSSRSAPILSASSRRTLARHIEKALQQRYGARGSLRQVVHSAVLELIAYGASGDAIRNLLVRSVEQHPLLYRWDRVSIVSGLSTSVDLTRQMLVWADLMTAIASPDVATVVASHGANRPSGIERPSIKTEMRWLEDGDA